jgi:hypothetical protein
VNEILELATIVCCSSMDAAFIGRYTALETLLTVR